MEKSYNKLIGYEQIPYKIISYLIENNENLWKLLKYPQSDALERPNLTLAEKASLIYNGQEDSSEYKVFLFEKTDDLFEDRTSQIRIFNLNTDLINRTVGVQDVGIFIAVHDKINMLNNYTNRMDNIVKEIFFTLNGSEIGTLGVLFCDEQRRRNTGIQKGFNLGNNRNFIGAQMIFAVNIA